MLTCLSRSVSVRSHGRLASLKHPVLSPPPLWNTPNKTPPKSSTNSYSKAVSFLLSFLLLPSLSLLPISVQTSSRFSLSISIVRSLWGAVPYYLFLSFSFSPSLSFSLSLFSLTTRPRSLCILAVSLTTLRITELISHHVQQLFRNQICDPYNHLIVPLSFFVLII